MNSIDKLFQNKIDYLCWDVLL